MDESMRKIWWIASFPKSGNTLVRMFLNAYVTKFPLNINAHYQYATMDSDARLYQRLSSRPLDDLQPAEIVYLRPAMLMEACLECYPRDACFKTHNAALIVGGVQLIPPYLTKEALYIVRDPRDVAVSYSRHGGKTIDETIEMMAQNNHNGKREHNIRDYICTWSEHVNSWLDIRAFPVHVMRFEDMIADRDTAFRHILPALGFRTIDEDSFEFALEQTSFKALQAKERATKFREAKHCKFFRQGRAGVWREILSAEQVERIETTHRDAMLRVGYEPSLVGV